MPQNNLKNQRGNALIFVLIAVALFAALAFTVSRGLNNQNTNTLSQRDAVLAAQDILSYAQKMARGVDRVRRRGCSESDISFENSIVSGYTNGASPGDNTCHIFHTSGGSVSWVSPPQDVNDGSEWVYTGETCIPNIGNGAGGCDGDGANNEELLMILPSLNQTVCETINEKLSLSSTITNTGTYTPTKFQGTFQDGDEIVIGITDQSACVVESGVYSFYSVLLER